MNYIVLGIQCNIRCFQFSCSAVSANLDIRFIINKSDGAGCLEIIIYDELIYAAVFIVVHSQAACELACAFRSMDAHTQIALCIVATADSNITLSSTGNEYVAQMVVFAAQINSQRSTRSLMSSYV